MKEKKVNFELHKVIHFLQRFMNLSYKQQKKIINDLERRLSDSD